MRRVIVIRRVVAVAASVLLLSSCYRSDFGVTVNDDGSGEVDIVLAVDPERLQELGEQFGDESGLGEDPCEQIRSESESGAGLPEGTEVEPYDEDGFCGVRVTAPFEAGTDISSFVLDDLEFGSDADSPVVFESFVIERDGEGWRFDATTGASSDTGGMDTGLLEGFLDDASNTVRVRLPGNVIEDDADRTEDGHLVWELDVFGSSRTLHARTGPGGGGGDGDGASVWLWIVLAAAAVAAVVVGVLLWRRSHSRTPPRPAPPGDGGDREPASVGAASATPPAAGAAPRAADGPQWDAQRQAYIQWDPVGNRWMQYDDGAREWKPL